MTTTMDVFVRSLGDELSGYYNDTDYGDGGYGYSDSYGKDEKKSYPGIDFSVMSVGIMTLAVVLIVEIARHHLDHKAHGRPFYKTVLEMCYSELTTLGIVEFCIYLLTTYYSNLDKQRYTVFSDVHFCLFYTAIINALQSCLLAIFCRRLTHREWVQTEHLELDHYVEIREAYDELHDKFHSTARVFDSFTWVDIWQTLRHPRMAIRYNQLLTQVRFHQLRLAFLKGKELPLQFKVSDYLKRGELHTLQHLVHISPLAWLLVMAASNLIFFLMGMVASVTGDVTAVGVGMTYIFMTSLFFFIGTSMVVYRKMNFIFKTIMTSRPEEGKLDQRSLFWGGNPSLVITILQFMQFAYAIFWAIVIVYWDVINDGNVHAAYFIMALGVCFTLFVYVAAQVIAKYVLCTSLGQLVNEKHLHETAAVFRLQERRRLNQVQQDEKSICDDKSLCVVPHNKRDSKLVLANLVESDTTSLRTALPDEANERLLQREQRRANRKAGRRAMSDGVGIMRQASMRNLSDGVTEMRRQGGGISASSSATSLSSMGNTSEPSTTGSRRPRIKISSASSQIQAMRIHEEEEEGDHELVGSPSTDNKLVHVDMSSMVDARPGTKVLQDDGSTGEHSDVNDIPHVDSSVASTEERQLTLSQRLRAYYLSTTYPFVSAIFGTMMCFLVLAMRVEVLLHKSGRIPNPDNTVDISLPVGFWGIVTCLVLFIANSTMCIVFFGPMSNGSRSRKERILDLAAVIDLVICGGCLAVLLVAEGERCCSDPTEGDNCCPGYGHRYYGGVGTIEPYTSLIALRVFRFLIAKRIVVRASGSGEKGKGGDWERSSTSSRSTGESDTKHDSNHHDAHSSHHHGDESMANEHGSLVALWETAIGRYPDIVTKHGEFSGELLQAMLGCQQKSASRRKSTSALGEPASPSKTQEKSLPTKPDRQQSVALSQEHYQGVSVEAQSIIVAGKIGYPVKPVNAGTGPKKKSQTPIDLNPTSQEFEVDYEQIEAEKKSPDETFLAPNARLIRSMKRCDKKLLPLLNKWATVDVAMTAHEIVFFNASNTEDAGEGFSEQKRQIREALRATKGGKGLRLCDVAAGRKVVGHLSLNDVTSVFVERIVHDGEATAPQENPTDLYTGVIADEYWTTKSSHHVGDRSLNRDLRWKRIAKEDHLQIKSTYGTLSLRFYVDLDDCESHQARSMHENEETGPIYKSNTFQWAQTLVRLRGSSHLHQSLPHFGDGDSEELRDYLKVVRHHEKGHKAMVRFHLPGHHRRHSSISGSSKKLSVDVPSGVAADEEDNAATRLSSKADTNGPRTMMHV